VYKSLKNAWAKDLDSFKLANPVGSPTKMAFRGLFAPAYHTAFNPVNIKNGFRIAGIYPVGHTAVNQEAVAPSRVRAENLDSSSPAGLVKPPSSKIMENIDSILSLPKCSEVNIDRYRGINDPKAKFLTPFPERKLRERPKKKLMQTTIQIQASPPHRVLSRFVAYFMVLIQMMWHLVTVLSGFRESFVVDNGMSSVRILEILHSSCVLNTTSVWNLRHMTIVTRKCMKFTVGNTEVQLTSSWRLIFMSNEE
jgi:hypothetical protein